MRDTSYINKLRFPLAQKLYYWLINDERYLCKENSQDSRRIDIWRFMPFIFIHVGCILIIFTGISGFAIGLAISMYFLRMFFITAFYHRCFSHRSFESGRIFRFIMAILGCTAGQRGPLWWASHHRQHHIYSDTDRDPHSPKTESLLYSHCLWFMTKGAFATKWKHIGDLKKYKELVYLEKLDWLPFLGFAAGCYFIGEWANSNYPSLETNGYQTLVWGFFISTTFLYHATFTINSLAHCFGNRRFETPDDSRNNFLLAILTLGEGWHNNHHRYPNAVRQGFYWWEVDIAYYGINLLRAFGLVRNLRPVPSKIIESGRVQR
tara:strand:+ start:588 stop:1550 length:963 start_codon:yes stop_codon:yes gene_type:complete